MSGRWQILPTAYEGRVDIATADKGRYVAYNVLREDALRMIHDPAQIADDAIGLFLEYRDRHGHDEDAARVAAVSEVVEGCTFDEEAFHREQSAEWFAAKAAAEQRDDRRLGDDDVVPTHPAVECYSAPREINGA